jgi:hypothetical protein
MLFPCLVLVLVTNLPALPTSTARFVKDHPEGPSLVLTLGSWRMRFAEKTSWTFRETLWEGAPVFVPSGFMQPVLNEARVPKGADPFLGTGHRREAIDSVELEILDGGRTNRLAVAEGLSIDRGEAFTVVKRSRFVSEFSGPLYGHVSRVTLDARGVSESYRFTALSPACSNVNYFYLFMHIFTNTTRDWAVGDDRGELTDRGVFGDDMSFSLRKDIRFALVLDPERRLGLALVYPETYVGRPGFKNSFWNRSYDNKLYLQIDPKRLPGERFGGEILTRVFAVDPKDFEARGRDLAREMMGLPAGATNRETRISTDTTGFGRASSPAPQEATPVRSSPPLLDGHYSFSFDDDRGFSFATGETISAEAHGGAGCLKIEGNGAFRYKKFPLVLEPACRYLIRGAVKKMAEAGRPASDVKVVVMNYTPANVLETFGTWGQEAPRDGLWHSFEGRFTTSTNLTARAGLVVYNAHAKENAFFDEIQIQKIP